MGELLNPYQALMFPRTLWEGIPANLKRACCEYAVIATERLAVVHPGSG
ncbi:hypothetical protein [Stenotrophomonas phage CM2]